MHVCEGVIESLHSDRVFLCPVLAQGKNLAYEEFPFLLLYLRLSFLWSCSPSTVPLHGSVDNYTTVPTAATLSCVMHSESNDLLSCITYLADVDLLDINRLGKNLLPPRPSVWLCNPQKCILCPLLGELGYCRLTMALSSRQLGSREVFPLGTEGRDPVLSQVCRFPSCLNYIWNSCLMA